MQFAFRPLERRLNYELLLGYLDVKSCLRFFHARWQTCFHASFHYDSISDWEAQYVWIVPGVCSGNLLMRYQPSSMLRRDCIIITVQPQASPSEIVQALIFHVGWRDLNIGSGKMWSAMMPPLPIPAFQEDMDLMPAGNPPCLPIQRYSFSNRRADRIQHRSQRGSGIMQ